jgi:hypothetical protein
MDAYRATAKAKAPHEVALSNLNEVQSALFDVFGKGEPLEFCEGCGAPFFEGDDYVVDENGVASCRYDIEGNKVGKCFANEMD